MKDNKLLAEYLEFRYHENTQGLSMNAYNHTLEPHGQCVWWGPNTDWNQLMMVVEKIFRTNKLELSIEDNIGTSDLQYQYLAILGFYEVDAIDGYGKTLIEAVYNACVEYIKTKKQ